MSRARECKLYGRAWVLAALGVLGCGIAQRTVEEREANGDASFGGATGAGANQAGQAASGQAGKSATSLGGASSGSAAVPHEMGGDATDDIGVELDPVPVSDARPPLCSCGQGCSQTECDVETLGAPSTFLMNVFVRDAQAYVMSRAQLLRSELDGAQQLNMAAELQFPSRVVADTKFAYFSSYVGLWKLPRSATNVSLADGNEAKLLSTLQPWKRRLTEITVDSRHVYWTTPVTDQLPARLTRTSVETGKSVELARLTNDDDWPLGIAVDDTDVYFTSNARLLRISKAGGELRELKRIGALVSYDEIHPMLSIALDERWVYYDAGNELRRLSKADGTSMTLFFVPLGDALSGIVVDEFCVYFGTRSGNIYRANKLESVPRLMVAGESNPLVSAVSHDAVYWVEQERGHVRRVRK